MGHIIFPEDHFAADVQRELGRARGKFDWLFRGMWEDLK